MHLRILAGKRPRTITLTDNHGAERRGAGAERAESGGVALKWRRGNGIDGMALVVAVRCGAALALVLGPREQQRPGRETTGDH